MKPLPSVVPFVIALLVSVVVGQDQAESEAGNLRYFEYFPRTYTYRYLGRTAEGSFRFKPMGGTVEPWTPEVVLKSGESSPGGYLTVLRALDDTVEVQVEPGGEKKLLRLKDTVAASTSFVGLTSKSKTNEVVEIVVETGKRFRFAQSDFEFIVVKAVPESIKLVRADQESAKEITIPRTPRPNSSKQRK